jgi:hypothetical protein
MSDRPRGNDPGAVWRDQPEENKAVFLEHIVDRKTQGLYANTRSEILTSIGSALLFAGVMAWRFGPYIDRLQEAGLAGIVIWVAVSVYRFRGWLRPEPEQADHAAAPGAEYYRRLLALRRDHLRSAWVWHGPLCLACIMLVAIVMGKTYPGPDRLGAVAPLLVLLAVWTGFGFRRRLQQAKALQREIDDLDATAGGRAR